MLKTIASTAFALILASTVATLHAKPADEHKDHKEKSKVVTKPKPEEHRDHRENIKSTTPELNERRDYSATKPNVVTTPEPATLALLAVGIGAFGGLRRFRR